MKSFLKRFLSSPVFITGFAFALRMVLMYVESRMGPNPVRTNIPYGYELGRVARAIASGEGFSSPLRTLDTGPTAWFTPIYPYFVAAIFKLFGIYSYLSEIIVQISNSAFAVLTIIPIHAIAKRTFGNGVAIGAAWTWVFFPTALFFPIMWIWDTALAALFFSLIFWATLALRGKRNVTPWLGYGALWVIGGLINPSILSLLPFFFGWLVWEAHKESAPWAKQVTMALLVFAIGLVPWTIRNYRVFGKVIVLRSNFGLELWLGNNPDVTGTISEWAHPNDNPAEAEKYKRMGEIAYMAEKQHEAFAFMRSHPLDTINFTFRRFVENWLAVTDSPADIWSHAPLYAKAFLVMNCLFPLLSFLGVLYVSRAREGEGFLFAAVLLIFPLVFYLTHSSLRYRFPIDPIMMVLAAGAVAHLLSPARSRNSDVTKIAIPASSFMAGSPSGFKVNK